MSTLGIMDRVKNTETRIWTPEGMVGADVIRAKREVESYDENLTLGRHALTGDWCIWLKQGPNKPPYPVLGIGRELPEPGVLRERLRAADTRIHGDAMLRRMNAENEALGASERDKADDAAGTLAEALDWARTDIKGYSGRVANVKGRKRDNRKDT